jgi:UDPglucose 6-dehydrogenase
VRAFDPAGMQQAQFVLPREITWCRDALDAVEGADALVVMTEWNEFRALAPERLRQAMRGQVVVDLRNIFDPSVMHKCGFTYTSIGRM